MSVRIYEISFRLSFKPLKERIFGLKFAFSQHFATMKSILKALEL